MIGHIVINDQGEISQELRDKVAKAPKIAFLESNLTWLILILGIQIPRNVQASVREQPGHTGNRVVGHDDEAFAQL